MVRLVDQDGAKVVVRELFQPFWAHQALDAAHRDAEQAVQAGLLGFFHRTAQAGGAKNFVCRLFQQLAPVGEDQDPLPGEYLILRDRGHDDGLAGAGGQDK